MVTIVLVWSNSEINSTSLISNHIQFYRILFELVSAYHGRLMIVFHAGGAPIRYEVNSIGDACI